MNRTAAPPTIWDSINLSVDIDYYVRLVWSRKWLVLAAGLLASLITAYFLFTKTPEFNASTTLLIETNIPRTMTVRGVYNPDSTSTEYFKTQVELVKSRKLVESVIQALKLEKNPELAAPNLMNLLEYKFIGLKQKYGFEFDPERIQEITDDAFKLENIIYSFSKRLNVRPVSHSKIISIGYRSADPELAANITNKVAQEYISMILDLRDEVSQLAYEEHYDKLTNTSTKRAELERKLNVLEKSNKSLVSGGEPSFYEKFNRDYLSEKLANDRLTLEELDRKLKMAEQQLVNLNDEDFEISAEFSNGSLSELQARYFEAKYDRDLLLKTFREEHPEVQDLLQKMQSIRSMIRLEAEKIPAEIRFQTEDARRRFNRQMASFKAMEKEPVSTVTVEREYDRLKNELEMTETLHERLTQKVREDLELKNSLFLVARVIDKATPPVKETGPRKLLLIGTAFMLGSLFVMMLVTFKDLFNTRVKYTKRFELAAKLHNIGVIPHLNSTDRLLKKLRKESTKLSKSERAFLEAYRTLKTNLILKTASLSKRAILVASSTPSEGKTTTCLWLAKTFAQSEKVLLIDADLRKAHLSKILLPKPGAGLTDALVTNQVPEISSITIGNATMDFISAGSHHEDPPALLNAASTGKHFQLLASQYDRIIIDSSPLCAVSDSLLLAKHLDVAVFVTRSNVTPQKVAIDGINRLRRLKVKVAGFVMTDVEEKYYRHLDDYAAYARYDRYYS